VGVVVVANVGQDGVNPLPPVLPPVRSAPVVLVASQTADAPAYPVEELEC
jgi:hypothetical protein